MRNTSKRACLDSHCGTATMSSSVAAAKPDLVIHVGDYVYRESACPPRDQGCKGSPYGDDWATWKADFFAPAAPALLAAP